MIRALLVDDEENNLDNLEFMLSNDCKGIVVAAKCRNAQEARNWLDGNTADVVFLDIQMPGETGFQFLQNLGSAIFKIVFVTAYNEYAIQAIKANALDYIVKPVRIEELQQAVRKIEDSLNKPDAAEQNRQLLAHFLESVGQKAAPKKYATPFRWYQFYRCHRHRFFAGGQQLYHYSPGEYAEDGDQ
jgi:two-component system, LytTR family, response regulator